MTQTFGSNSEIIAAASGVVAHVGDDDFAAAVIDAAGAIVPFESSLFMGCVEGRAPQLLFDGLGENEKAVFVGAYMGGAYLLAPGYRAAQNPDVSGVRHLSAVFPGEMETSQYFSEYWGQTGMIDELFLFTRLDDERATYLAMGRYEGSEVFSADDQERLTLAAPIIQEAIRRHWRDRAFGVEDEASTAQGHEKYHELLTGFGAAQLTPREYDVCQLMLHGHSSKSGARELGISPETERIHRGRVFQKLGVTSQVEILAMFLQTLADENPQGLIAKGSNV